MDLRFREMLPKEVDNKMRDLWYDWQYAKAQGKIKEARELRKELKDYYEFQCEARGLICRKGGS